MISPSGTGLWRAGRLAALAFVALAAGLLLRPADAIAGVGVTIDLSAQQMDVAVDGSHAFTWPVSTARRGYRTPLGSYHPIRLERMWYSRKYDMAPMPHSIFFHGGYAIHGTTDISNLGRPASHGCVRLHPENARILFSLVSKRRYAETVIRVVP